MSVPLPVPQNPTSPLPLDPRTYARGLSCVHCGLCLPACPTYTQTLNEADSPRGRIQLMLGLADGKIDATESVKRHLDLCLDCRACETACPSGVVYHELIEETRAKFAEQDRKRPERRSIEDLLLRILMFRVLPYPKRLRAAMWMGKWVPGFLLPGRLRKMAGMIPVGRGEKTLTPALSQSTGRGGNAGGTTVAFFSGCIGSVVYDHVNRQAIGLLRACGAEVLLPAQNCCGAIHHHNGEHAGAVEFAKRNIDTMLASGVDYIVTTIAGCGAMLREYDFQLRDDAAYRDRAIVFSRKVRDISEVLIELGLPA